MLYNFFMVAIDPKKAPDWMLSGECTRPENQGLVWVPNKGQSTADAKRVCNMCEFRSECLDYAIAFDMEGVWGGTDSNQRRRRFSRTVRDMIKDEYFDAA